MLKITNAVIITDGKELHGLNLAVSNGIIKGLTAEDFPADRTLDAGGLYLAPGFVDIHCHGGGGSDFLDGTEADFLAAARLHLAHGTTTMLPTTVASTNEECYALIDAYNAAKRSPILRGSFFAGLHMEGPYFAPEYSGAQDKSQLRLPDPKEYLPILDACGDIRRWSVAPELPGALEMGRELRRRGILAAAAHTAATYEDMVAAVDAGYSHVTHLYSCTSTVTRHGGFRSAGVIESALLMDELTVELIADGCHLPAPLLKLVYKVKGPRRTALVTDSIRGAGMPEGDTIIGSRTCGQHVLIEDGVAKLYDRTAFAGSVATADRLVRTMVRLAGVPLADAVLMMTETPARIAGLKGIGRIAEGYRADLVLFDGEIDVKRVLLAGHNSYEL